MAASAARSSVVGGLRRTASAIVGRPVSGSHVLRVDGYSHLRQMFAHGRHASSREFPVAGHDWRLLLYPNGSHARFKDHVSVLLQLASAPGAVVMARPRFTVLGRPGNPAAAAAAALPNDCGMHGFWHDSSWGARDLIERERLETSEEYLHDDCFAVRCDVDVLTARACPDDSAFSTSISLSVDHEPAA